jgi:tetratricopeptide (TPR) repeat protein
MKSKNRNLYIVLGVVVLLIIINFVWLHFSEKKINMSATQQSATGGLSSEKATSAPISVTISPVGQTKTSVAEPSLDRPLPDTAGIDPQFVATTEAEMQTTISDLQKNKNSFQDWINLGVERKSLGDYAGAALAWQYVSVLYPTNIVSFGNLGDLYTNFLKNYSEAEVDYLTEIKNAPADIDAYRNLSALYISEGKTGQAVSLLQSGIAQNPNSSDLKNMLARIKS